MVVLILEVFIDTISHFYAPEHLFNPLSLFLKVKLVELFFVLTSKTLGLKVFKQIRATSFLPRFDSIDNFHVILISVFT